jgi:hypothetical protein
VHANQTFFSAFSATFRFFSSVLKASLPLFIGQSSLMKNRLLTMLKWKFQKKLMQAIKHGTWAANFRPYFQVSLPFLFWL